MGRLHDAGAIDKLPGFGVSGPQLGPQELGAEGHNVSQAGTDGSNAEPVKVPDDKALCHNLARRGADRRK